MEPSQVPFMTVYILRRLLMLIPILLGVSFLTFAIIKVTPGDPAQIMLGMRATPEKIAQLHQQLHLDDPFLAQYGRYVWNALHGDLGRSIRGGTPVLQEILNRFPSTLELTVFALVLAVTGRGFGWGHRRDGQEPLGGWRRDGDFPGGAIYPRVLAGDHPAHHLRGRAEMGLGDGRAGYQGPDIARLLPGNRPWGHPRPPDPLIHSRSRPGGLRPDGPGKGAGRDGR